MNQHFCVKPFMSVILGAGKFINFGVREMTLSDSNTYTGDTSTINNRSLMLITLQC